MNFPSGEVVHTFESPTTNGVKVILPLDDGDSFVCGFECETLVMWKRIGTQEESPTTSNLSFMQLLLHQTNAADRWYNVVDYNLVLLKQSRKLISYVEDYNSKIVRAWDISSGQGISTAPELVSCRSAIIELGSNELLVVGPCPSICDSLGSKVLAVIYDIPFNEIVQLSNGNLVVFHRPEKDLIITEYQVMR